jgi:hypothetical protein
MKRILLVALLALIISAVVLVPAQAHELNCQEMTPAQYAAMVAMMAHEGMLSGDMNPGVHHEGYSICVVP